MRQSKHKKNIAPLLSYNYKQTADKMIFGLLENLEKKWCLHDE